MKIPGAATGYTQKHALKTHTCELLRRIDIPLNTIGNKLSLKFFRGNYDPKSSLQVYRDGTQIWDAKTSFGPDWKSISINLPSGEYTVQINKTKIFVFFLILNDSLLF